MKKTLLLTLIIAALCFNMNAQSPWTPVTSGTGEVLTSLYFADENTGYAVGYGGVILKTFNSGATWVPQYSGTNINFYSMAFTDADTGWIVGDDGTIEHTTDGGASWIPVFTPASGVNLRVVWFLNPSVGFIAGGLSGTNSTIIKTTDGGATWTDISPNNYQAVYGLFFTSPLVGYASDYNGVMAKTIDGGATWTSQTISVNNLHSIYFTDADTGYAAGGSVGSDSGVILKTTDAGASWSEYSIPGGFLTGITFLDANTGIAVGGSVANNTGVILKTTDAGATWTPETIYPAPSSRQFRVFMYSYQLGFSCGLNGTILRTTGITSTASPERQTAFLPAISPNPNPGVFKVELPQPATENMSLRITDFTGRLLLEKQTETGIALQTIQAETLSDGTYLLQVISEGRILAVQRFVKQ